MNTYQRWKELGSPTDYLMACWLASQSDDPAIREENEWAFMEPADEALENPEKAWEYILFAIVDRRFSDNHIAIMAAGALEELLSHHGAAFIERVEHQAKIDKRFARMLGGVWRFQMNDEISSRVQAASAQGGHGDGPRQS